MFLFRAALCAVCLAALAACQSTSVSTVDRPTATRASNDFEQFYAIASRISAVAEDMCVDQNPAQAAKFCDFSFQIVGGGRSAPRATQSIGSDGRPVITVTPSIIGLARNDDELAFVLAHEVSHQIANHLGRANELAFASNGAGGFTIGRPSRKSLELEADSIAVGVTNRAGYDPKAGSQAISRFGRTFSGRSDTHPSVQERFDVVNRALLMLRV